MERRELRQDLTPNHSSSLEATTAVFVPPPWRVTRGRQRTLTAPRVNASSVERLLQTYASPGPRAASLAGVRPSRAAFAFWMCFSQAGELNLCSMMWVDSSMSEVGTDGGSCDATMTRRALVAHLAHDLDQSRHEVGAVDGSPATSLSVRMSSAGEPPCSGRVKPTPMIAVSCQQTVHPPRRLIQERT